MTEAAPSETLSHIAKQVKISLESTKDFWTDISDDSKLLPLIDLKGMEYSFMRALWIFTDLCA